MLQVMPDGHVLAVVQATLQTACTVYVVFGIRAPDGVRLTNWLHLGTPVTPPVNNAKHLGSSSETSVPPAIMLLASVMNMAFIWQIALQKPAAAPGLIKQPGVLAGQSCDVTHRWPRPTSGAGASATTASIGLASIAASTLVSLPLPHAATSIVKTKAIGFFIEDACRAAGHCRPTTSE